MYKSLIGQYALKNIDDESFTSEFVNNKIMTPRLFRYAGMGYYEVVAESNYKLNYYFLVMLGGSNGYDVLANRRDLRKMTTDDAVDFDQLIENLKLGNWRDVNQ